MTSEEYDKLTEDEQCIQVAELCGWESDGDVCFKPGVRQPKRKSFWKRGEQSVLGCPDYAGDLNACQEFKDILGNKLNQFRCNVESMVYNHRMGATADHLLFVPADVLCKAFVLALTSGE
jgi:hypothetical protein